MKSAMEQNAHDIVRKLRAARHVAYYAGGCVRDLLSGKPPKDIDIATDARPDVVQKLFPRTYAVGAHFGGHEDLGRRCFALSATRPSGLPKTGCECYARASFRRRSFPVVAALCRRT